MTILSTLQEISRNPDTLCITPKRSMPVLSWIETASRSDPECIAPGEGTDLLTMYSERVDLAGHTGPKPVRGTGLARHNGFAAFCFERPNRTIIAGGHSLFFREFFRTFLCSAATSSVEKRARKVKMANGGVVGFTLVRAPRKDAPSEFEYKIRPASLVQLHREAW